MTIINRGTPVPCTLCKRQPTDRYCDGCKIIICSDCDSRDPALTVEHEIEDHVYPELESATLDPDGLQDDSKVDPGQTSN